MASLRPDTGVSRGPQRYGAAEKDSDRDALRDELRRFEALAEPGNEEHQQVLRQMKEHTQELEFQRGVWTQRGMPGVTRDWNQPPKHGGPPPEQAVLELKAWREATRKTALLLAGQPLPPELKGEPPRRIMDAPAGDTQTGGYSGGAAHGRCGIRTAGRTRASFLAQLDAESAIDWEV